MDNFIWKAATHNSTIVVVKIKIIPPLQNFAEVRCGSFGLVVFTDISKTTVLLRL